MRRRAYIHGRLQVYKLTPNRFGVGVLLGVYYVLCLAFQVRAPSCTMTSSSSHIGLVLAYFVRITPWRGAVVRGSCSTLVMCGCGCVDEVTTRSPGEAGTRVRIESAVWSPLDWANQVWIGLGMLLLARPFVPKGLHVS